MLQKNVKPGVYWLDFWNSETQQIEPTLIYLLTESEDTDYVLIWIGQPALSKKEEDLGEEPVIVDISLTSQWYFYLSGIHPLTMKEINYNLNGFSEPITISEKSLIDFNIKFLQLLKLNVSPVREDPDGFVQICAELETDLKDLNRIREENLRLVVKENETFIEDLNGKLADVEVEINKILDQIKETGHVTKPLLDELEVYNNELNKLELEMTKQGELLDIRTTKLNSNFYNKVTEIEEKTKNKMGNKKSSDKK